MKIIKNGGSYYMKSDTLTIQILDEFKDFLISEEKSEATIQKYMHDAKCFFEYSKSQALSKSMVIDYKQELINRNYSVSSVNTCLSSLNCLFVFLGRNDLKTKKLKKQRDVFRSEDAELKKEEYLRLVKSAHSIGNERLELTIETICSTGIRVSELSFITLDALIKGVAVVSNKGKTRKVFIVKKLKEKLLQYARKQNIKEGSIFVTRTGKPLDRTNIWRDMKKLCKLASVDPQKVYPHNLRHLFARAFYELEKDIVKLSDLLGHCSIDTTRIYIISTGYEHRKRMEKMRLIV